MRIRKKSFVYLIFISYGNILANFSKTLHSAYVKRTQNEGF